MSDVRNAVKISTRLKWTRSETGRHLHEQVPIADKAHLLDYSNPVIGKIMSQFRTGYNRLNKYRHQVGHSLTLYCK